MGKKNQAVKLSSTKTLDKNKVWSAKKYLCRFVHPNDRPRLITRPLDPS